MLPAPKRTGRRSKPRYRAGDLAPAGPVGPVAAWLGWAAGHGAHAFAVHGAVSAGREPEDYLPEASSLQGSVERATAEHVQQLLGALFTPDDVQRARAEYKEAQEKSAAAGAGEAAAWAGASVLAVLLVALCGVHHEALRAVRSAAWLRQHINPGRAPDVMRAIRRLAADGNDPAARVEADIAALSLGDAWRVQQIQEAVRTEGPGALVAQAAEWLGVDAVGLARAARRIRGLPAATRTAGVMRAVAHAVRVMSCLGDQGDRHVVARLMWTELSDALDDPAPAPPEPPAGPDTREHQQALTALADAHQPDDGAAARCDELRPDVVPALAQAPGRRRRVTRSPSRRWDATEPMALPPPARLPKPDAAVVRAVNAVLERRA